MQRSPACSFVGHPNDVVTDADATGGRPSGRIAWRASRARGSKPTGRGKTRLTGLPGIYRRLPAPSTAAAVVWREEPIVSPGPTFINDPAQQTSWRNTCNTRNQRLGRLETVRKSVHRPQSAARASSVMTLIRPSGHRAPAPGTIYSARSQPARGKAAGMKIDPELSLLIC